MTRGSFLKSPGNFSARKGIFSSSVYQNGEVYTAETSCMKGTSVHIKNMRIKQLCNAKCQNFAAAFRVWQLIGTFEIRALGPSFRKPVNAKPGIKVTIFLVQKIFFTAYGLYSLRLFKLNRKDKQYKQENRKVTKLKSKFAPTLG